MLLGPDYRTVPHALGHWTTREIAAEPPGSGAGGPPPLWRVSIARILVDCEFSHLPGIDRTILRIGGGAASLDLGAHGTLALAPLLVPRAFKGDWPARCRLADGPAEVFNVMTQAAAARHRVAVVELGEAAASLGESGETTLFYCHSGMVAVDADIRLTTGQAWRGAAPRCRALGGPAVVIVVAIGGRPRGGAA